MSSSDSDSESESNGVVATASTKPRSILDMLNSTTNNGIENKKGTKKLGMQEDDREVLQSSLAAARQKIRERRKENALLEKTEEKKKKKKKDTPLEVSNRKQFSIEEKKKQKKPVAMDPRFNDLCGTLNVDAVGRNYAFLDEYRANEKDALKKEWKKTKNPEIVDALHQMQQEEKKRQDLADYAQMKRNVHAKEKEKILAGKKAFYHSGAQIRKLVKKEKLDKMGEKAAGKLLAKREKRVAGTEKKKLIKRRT